MKNLVLIIQLSGLAFILTSIVCFMNYFFGLGLDYRGIEFPNDIMSAIIFLVIGLIVTVIGLVIKK